MTLNITVVSKDVAFQSSDFRLTSWVQSNHAYERVDYPFDKQVAVIRGSWTASVCFTGVALMRHGSVRDVCKWLTHGVATLDAQASFEDLISILLKADEWLRGVTRERRHHTFTVVGFLADRVEVAVISNFEGLSLAPLKTLPDRLFVTRRLVREPMVVVTGRPDSVPRYVRRLLRDLLPGPEDAPVAATPAKDGERQLSVQLGGLTTGDGGRMLDALVRANISAARWDGTQGTVSEECLVTVMQKDGQSWSYPVGIPDDQDYVPEHAKHLVAHYKRKVGADGRPEAIRVKQMMSNREAGLAAVTGFVISGLEEKKGEASCLETASSLSRKC